MVAIPLVSVHQTPFISCMPSMAFFLRLWLARWWKYFVVWVFMGLAGHNQRKFNFHGVGFQGVRVRWCLFHDLWWSVFVSRWKPSLAAFTCFYVLCTSRFGSIRHVKQIHYLIRSDPWVPWQHQRHRRWVMPLKAILDTSRTPCSCSVSGAHPFSIWPALLASFIWVEAPVGVMPHFTTLKAPADKSFVLERHPNSVTFQTDHLATST